MGLLVSLAAVFHPCELGRGWFLESPPLPCSFSRRLFFFRTLVEHGTVRAPDTFPALIDFLLFGLPEKNFFSPSNAIFISLMERGIKHALRPMVTVTHSRRSVMYDVCFDALLAL